MRNPTLESASNALAVVRMFTELETLTVTQVAERLDVAKSTAHRLLTTLVEAGFAQRDPRRRHYHPGPALVAAGLGAMGALDVTRRAHQHAADLAERIGETVTMAVLQGSYARCVAAFTPATRRLPGFSATVGRLLPLHSTASGKILLAGRSEEEIRSLYPGGLAALTPRSITDIDVLMVELERTKRRKWAISDEESTHGVVGLAVPVYGETTRIAAIAVAAPADSLPGSMRLSIVDELFRTADGIRRAK